MKTVHWQLPFASLNGTQYRIDIYAEGAPVWGVKTLTGGSTPFITDEDNSDDFFAPVRSQTGCINIIDEDGTLMESGIMPSDNVDKPVRLIRVSDGAVMWQGFLSCETYSQAYTSRPNEVTLNVNSVLEAMASVNMKNEHAGFYSVNQLIKYVMLNIMEKSGIDGFIPRYYIPTNGYNILYELIDTTSFFNDKEEDNENYITHTIVGIDLKTVLNRLCTYMGWTVRENGDSVYITDGTAQTVRGFIYVTYTRSYEQATSAQTVVEDMSDYAWRGTGHQIETRQGAKSVEVVANVQSDNVNIGMPVRFVGDVTRLFDYLYVYQQGSNLHDIKYGMQLYAFHGENADAHLTLGHTSAIININAQVPAVSSYIRDTTLANVLSHMALVGDSASGPDSSYLVSTVGAGQSNVRYYAGAFYAKLTTWKLTHPRTGDDKYDPEDTTLVDVEGQGTVCTYPEPSEGVYCVFFPRTYKAGVTNSFDPSMSKPIMVLRSGSTQVFYDGYLNLTSAYTVIYHNIGVEDSSSILLKHAQSILSSQWSVGATLRIGDRYWNGHAWQDTECRFRLAFQDGDFRSNWDKYTLLPPTKGLLIPVNDGMHRGEVELSIWPDISSSSISESESVLEMFFTKLSIAHVYPSTAVDEDQSQNHYYQDIADIRFGDEVKVSVDIASHMRNKPSPHILMNSETEPMTTLTYADGTTERPERHLLARLATYYGAARTRITMEADRPTSPLPLTRITGYDGKTYLPLSESRDWRTDVSTIKCFECP